MRFIKWLDILFSWYLQALRNCIVEPYRSPFWLTNSVYLLCKAVSLAPESCIKPHSFIPKIHYKGSQTADDYLMHD